MNQKTQPGKVSRGRPPRDRSRPEVFPPLELETRSHTSTRAAAHYLNLAPQTLRFWACSEKGGIRPLRIKGKLGLLWPVDGIRKLLGVEVQQ